MDSVIWTTAGSSNTFISWEGPGQTGVLSLYSFEKGIRMYEFEVIVHGPNGYFESGRYRTAFIVDAFDVSERLINNLADEGYIRLSHTDGSYTVIFKESVMSFSVRPIEEEEK